MLHELGHVVSPARLKLRRLVDRTALEDGRYVDTGLADVDEDSGGEVNSQSREGGFVRNADGRNL